MDYEFPQSLQNKMAKNLNAEQIVTLNSGHLPMISHPKKLADHLNKFVAKCKPKSNER